MEQANLPWSNLWANMEGVLNYVFLISFILYIFRSDSASIYTFGSGTLRFSMALYYFPFIQSFSSNLKLLHALLVHFFYFNLFICITFHLVIVSNCYLTTLNFVIFLLFVRSLLVILVILMFCYVITLYFSFVYFFLCYYVFVCINNLFLCISIPWFML